jgi:SacI homology domain
MLNQDYNGGQILCINLVTTENKNENMLKNRYEDLINRSDLLKKQVMYKFFDFHVECHKNSDPMMELVDNFVF